MNYLSRIYDALRKPADVGANGTTAGLRLRAERIIGISLHKQSHGIISFFLGIIGLILFSFPVLCNAVPPGTVITNAAVATYTDDPSPILITRSSNTVIVTTIAARTPAVLELLQYAPTSLGAQLVPVSLSAYSTSGTASGPFVVLGPPVPAGSGTPINLSNPVPLVTGSQYHVGEPVFIRLTDFDQNLDPTTAETVLVTVRDDLTNDVEVIRLTETGPNTGIFTGYVQTSPQSAVIGNGVLSVTSTSHITASYVDVADPTDFKTASVLVDPYGRVFSSSTGQPVDGVSVTLMNTTTNLPAVVYGDDGVSSFPATITTGSSATDSSGRSYSFPSGGYRFPFMAPGSYRLQVTAPTGYRAPSTVATAVLQTLPGAPFVIVQGSRGESFTINAGPVIHIDIPIDPLSNSRLFLVKSASKSVVSIGDFLQYKLNVQNTDTTAPVLSVVLTDHLPLGFRYRKGSIKVNSVASVEPSLSSDGRTLTVLVGDIPASGQADISYVTEVSAGASLGTAVNSANAADFGGVVSNTAKASVLVKEDLFGSKAIIVGRVMVDGCGKPDASEEGGLEGVRIFMENGIYAVTDKNGMYHFEGVNPGSHVVQVDLESLSKKYEIVECEENSRFAGTAFSQFVDVQGGTLWRADFHAALKPKVTGEAGVELRSLLKKGPTAKQNIIEYSVPVQVGSVPLHNLRITIMLPQGAGYQAGSTRLNAVPQQDPSIVENTLTFRLGDATDTWEGTVRFNATVPVEGLSQEMTSKALLVFDTPQKKDERSPVVDNVLVRGLVEERDSAPDLIFHPSFAVLSADLTTEATHSLDRMIKDLKAVDVKHMTVTGHTDSNAIRAGGTSKYKDNYELSRARAESVGRYIAAALKISPDQMIFVGKGPDQPIASNKTEAGRAQNRRVEIVLKTEIGTVAYGLKNEKDSSGMKTVAIEGLRPGEQWVALETKKVVNPIEKKMPEYTKAWVEAAEPGFAWLWPGDNYYPTIPAVKIAIKHDPAGKLKLFVNGDEVSSLLFDGILKRQDNKVAVSTWRGVPLVEGDNLIEAIEYDAQGVEKSRMKRTMHYSGPPVKAELAPLQSKLVADGKTPPVIAVRFIDKDNRPAREGVIIEYSVNPPHIAQQRAEDLQKNPLTASTSDRLRAEVGENGIALIELQPTTQTGEAVIKLPLVTGVQELRAWLKPELRDWILVGIAEGTVGYNVVKGNMESASASGMDDKLYKDDKLAFYAKGTIKGEWLLTIAYDGDRHGQQGQGSLYQKIDPNKYYTLYGDATEQRADAASARALYLKIERDQFYALFGDYDTGLTVTELSRYSRQYNGLKSEMKSDHFDFTVFASQSDQTFAKDEIQGDGTSGLYHLSKKNILINSETVVIETRDRFRSEVILSSQAMSRSLDYTIDYDAGTIWFKSPVFSTDANFNPNIIVVKYEILDSSGAPYNYGGRGAVRVLDNKVELGMTRVHEEANGGSGNLTGVDATVKLDEHTKLKTEVASSKNDEAGTPSDGRAYLAEVSRRTENMEGKAYVRELQPGFGLGQQNNSETGTRKVGYDLMYRLNPAWSLSSQAFRQENLTANAVRDMAEIQGTYKDKRYEFFTGARLAQDTYADGTPSQTSDQVFIGSRYQMTDRLSVNLRRDQSLGTGSENANVDFPTRTTVGADFKLSATATLFANQEWTQGAQQDSSTSRIGIKATPWTGGQVSSTVEQQSAENGERLFSTLGLKQSWQINKQWSVDAGLDRSQTISQSSNNAQPQTTPLFNVNVPQTTEWQDFTAVSLGAGYKMEKWSWTGRVEERYASDNKKSGLFTGANGELKEGLGVAAGLQMFASEFDSGSRTMNGDLRFGLAYRPKQSAWIVLDRLDFIIDKRRDTTFDYESWRIVNNLNTNYKAGPKTQLALQYACKYVQETIDDLDYRGYTDLTGVEVRYDVTKKWDIGLRERMLHSWSVQQYNYGTSVSLGYNFVKNIVVRVGYNITGFTDRDFSKADFTSEGPFLKLSMKFDQVSARRAVKWISGQ